MSEERLELVTDFGSLKAGDLVVTKPCRWCGAEHRRILVRLRSGWWENPDGSMDETAGWAGLPPPPCTPRLLVLTPVVVAERRCYRVIIPPAQEARETARPRKLERVR